MTRTTHKFYCEIDPDDTLGLEIEEEHAYFEVREIDGDSPGLAGVQLSRGDAQELAQLLGDWVG